MLSGTDGQLFFWVPESNQQFKLTNAESHCFRLCRYWNWDRSELGYFIWLGYDKIQSKYANSYHTKIKTIVDYKASKVTARYRLHIKLKKGQEFVQEFASDSVLQYESPLSKTEASASPGKEQTALWCALEKVIQKQLRINVSDINS